MKQTFFDFIKTCIQAGHWVAVQHNDGDWKVFIFVRDNKFLQGTYYQKTVEECISFGLSDSYFSKEYIEEKFKTNYKIVTPTPNLLKTGDKCEVLDSELIRKYAKENRWGEEKVGLIGGKGFEVKELNIPYSHYEIWTKDKSDWFYYPTWAVAPYFEEETKIDLSDEELIRELEKRNLVINGKVLK